MIPSSSLMQAAVVVASLPKQQAAKLLMRLEPADLKTVLDAVTRLDDVSASEISSALQRLSIEAQRWAIADDSEEGTKYSRAKMQLNEALADSSNELEKKLKDGKPFDFLVEMIPMIRIHLLADEHPRSIAIVLSTLPPEIASETMTSLDEGQRVSVLKRLCELEEIHEQEVMELSFALKLRLKKIMNSRQSQSDGVNIASGLLSCSDSKTRESMLTHVSQTDPELAEKLQRSIFKIERLEKLDKATVKTILKHVDTSSWAPALKNASAELQTKILTSMAPRPGEFLAFEISEIGHVSASVEDLARQNIIQVVLQLARDGKVELRSRKRESNHVTFPSVGDQVSNPKAASFIS